MRFGEGKIGLSVIEAELIMHMPFDAHRAFGSIALLAVVGEKSAQALIRIITSISDQGVNPTTSMIRTAALEKGDNYIQIPDIDRVREQLEELFNDRLVANAYEVSESEGLRHAEVIVAENAVSQLRLA